jgi:hypothetical protein
MYRTVPCVQYFRSVVVHYLAGLTIKNPPYVNKDSRDRHVSAGGSWTSDLLHRAIPNRQPWAKESDPSAFQLLIPIRIEQNGFQNLLCKKLKNLGFKKIRKEPGLRKLCCTVRMVSDLHRLVTFAAPQGPPLLLVGSELGALVVRAFAHLHPQVPFFYSRSSVADPWHVCTGPQIRASDQCIRILLFSSVTFKTPSKNWFFI